MSGFKDYLILTEMARKEPAKWKAISKPKKTMKVYKLFGFRGGKLYSTQVDTSRPYPIGKWIQAEFKKTKGYADRGGFHAGEKPISPQMKGRDGTLDPKRVWALVEIDVTNNLQKYVNTLPTKDIRGGVPENGYYEFDEIKGVMWYVSSGMKIIRILGDDEVAKLTGRLVLRKPNKEMTNKNIRKMYSKNQIPDIQTR